MAQVNNEIEVCATDHGCFSGAPGSGAPTDFSGAPGRIRTCAHGLGNHCSIP